jgi:ATP-binding cassette subfamily B protein
MLAAILVNLGLNTLDGRISPGSFIFYFQALQRLQSGFRNFLTGVTTLLRMNFFLKNLSAFLDLPLRVKHQALAPFPAVITQGITLQNVTFCYPDNERAVLQNINMSFHPGKVIAIIGENGSGKSTLVKLLARLYEMEGGKILLEDLDIEKIDPKQYAANVSVLFQDFNQYHFPLADNIMLSGERDVQRLQNVATGAGLNDLLQELPKGFDTSLGKMFGDDVELSGGQWQKIAIARMLYRNTPVLILDEPTSNIDPLAEYEILKRITAEKKDRIIILITHRLHNLKFADHVYLMDHGKIHGEGTVDELLERSELFRQMYDRQELAKMKA